MLRRGRLPTLNALARTSLRRGLAETFHGAKLITSSPRHGHDMRTLAITTLHKP